MSYEEQEWMEYCDRQTWRHAPLALLMIATYPMSVPNPDYDYDYDF